MEFALLLYMTSTGYWFDVVALFCVLASSSVYDGLMLILLISWFGVLSSTFSCLLKYLGSLKVVQNNNAIV